jgi:hypothetical protein
MPENKPFVINDRRKFTPEGELRPDAPAPEPKSPRPETLPSSAASDGPVAVPPQPHAASPAPASTSPAPADDTTADELPPPPTSEQTSQATTAYDATVARLDTALRATNPGMEPIPEMTFDRLVQSLYMQAILQLGGAAEPGQQPQVDILGARQTIDMLAIFKTKTAGNLSDPETKLIDSALFELRMAFLEVTQMLARQAQTRQQPGAPAAPNASGNPAGPRIVR